MDLGLRNRVALGAASGHGLGKAVAFGLGRERAKLALCARNPAALQTAAEVRPRRLSMRRRWRNGGAGGG